MTAYYNEIDPKAAAWLRELIKRGHIAPGDVDERSITEVRAEDLRGYTQCHFFAGIGGWSLALRMAGWPDYIPVWTGSCPCQPFSVSNSRKHKDGAFADERHLWPSLHRLIDQGEPAVVFGEQVASPDGLAWLDAVYADLEASRYAVGSADLCAAGVGAPHIRQRLYWVALACSERFEGLGLQLRARGSLDAVAEAWRRRESVEHASGAGSGRDPGAVLGTQEEAGRSVRGESDLTEPPSYAGIVADTYDPGSQRRSVCRFSTSQRSPRAAGVGSQWSDVAWALCNDPRGPTWRPIEPGTEPVADGIPARVGRLRGYGNAIVPPLAAEFIKATVGVPT